MMTTEATPCARSATTADGTAAEAPPSPAAAPSTVAAAGPDEEDASYTSFLRALDSEGTLPVATPDDGARGGDELDIDAMMAADGVSVTEHDEARGDNESSDDDDDDDILEVGSPSWFDVTMLQDILDKADLDIDIMMLKDLLESREFAALLGERLDASPPLDVLSADEWAALVRERMCPSAAAAAKPAAAVEALWSEILAGPSGGPPREAGPPPSWFNAVCAWFGAPGPLADDAAAPGATPSVRVVVARGEVLRDWEGPAGKTAGEDDTASEASTLQSVV